MGYILPATPEADSLTYADAGTLVWARSGAFPFFPAEVADLDADDTPDWLKDAKPKNDTDKVPVMFFDGGRSGYVTLAREIHA